MSETYLVHKEIHRLEDKIQKLVAETERLKKQHKALSRKLLLKQQRDAVFNNLTEGEINDLNDSRA